MRFKSDEEKSLYYGSLLPIAKELGISKKLSECELVSIRELTELILNNIRGRKKAGIRMRKAYKELTVHRDNIAQIDINEYKKR